LAKNAKKSKKMAIFLWSVGHRNGSAERHTLQSWRGLLFHVIGCACTHVASRRPRS
jgi:hypothetical protein